MEAFKAKCEGPDSDEAVLLWLLGSEGQAMMSDVYLTPKKQQPHILGEMMMMKKKRVEVGQIASAALQAMSMEVIDGIREHPNSAEITSNGPYLSRAFGRAGSCIVQGSGFFGSMDAILLMGVLGATALRENDHRDTARGDIMMTDKIVSEHKRAMAIKVLEVMAEYEVGKRERKSLTLTASSRADFSVGSVATKPFAAPYIRSTDPIFELPDGWSQRHWQRMVQALLLTGATSVECTQRRNALVAAAQSSNDATPSMKNFISRLDSVRLMSLDKGSDASAIPATDATAMLALSDDDFNQPPDPDGWQPATWIIFAMMQLVAEDGGKPQSPKAVESRALLATFLEANAKYFPEIAKQAVDDFACDPQGLLGRWLWHPHQEDDRVNADTMHTAYEIAVKVAYSNGAAWKRTTGSKFEYKGSAKRSFLGQPVFMKGADKKAADGGLREEDLIVYPEDYDFVFGKDRKETRVPITKGRAPLRVQFVLQGWVEVKLAELPTPSTDGGTPIPGESATLLVRSHCLTLVEPSTAADKKARERFDAERRPIEVDVLHASNEVLDVTIAIKTNWNPDSAKEEQGSMAIRFFKNNVLVQQVEAKAVCYEDEHTCFEEQGLHGKYRAACDDVQQNLLEKGELDRFAASSDAVVALFCKHFDVTKLGWMTSRLCDRVMTHMPACFYRVFPERRSMFLHWVMRTGQVDLAEAIVKRLKPLDPQVRQGLLRAEGRGFETAITASIKTSKDDSDASAKFIDAIRKFSKEDSDVVSEVLVNESRLPVGKRNFLHIRALSSLHSAVSVVGEQEPPVLLAILVSAAANGDVETLHQVISAMKASKSTGRQTRQTSIIEGNQFAFESMDQVAGVADALSGHRRIHLDEPLIPGVFALGEAARNGHMKAVKLLLEGGADPKKHYGSALWLAVCHKHWKVAECLLSHDRTLDSVACFSTASPSPSEHRSGPRRPIPFAVPPEDEIRFFSENGLLDSGYGVWALQHYRYWCRGTDVSSVFATLRLLLDAPSTDFGKLMDDDVSGAKATLFKECSQYPICQRGGELFAALLAFYAKATPHDRKSLLESFTVGDVTVNKNDDEHRIKFPFHFLFERAVSVIPARTPFWDALVTIGANADGSPIRVPRGLHMRRNVLRFLLRPVALTPSMMKETTTSWTRGNLRTVATYSKVNNTYVLNPDRPATTISITLPDSKTPTTFRTSAFGLTSINRATSSLELFNAKYFCFLYSIGTSGKEEKKPDKEKDDGRPKTANAAEEMPAATQLRTFGGYAYFDERFALVEVKAIGLPKSADEPADIEFKGPVILRESALRHHEIRWCNITIKQLNDVGARRYMWLAPHEDEQLRSETPMPHGAFAYEFTDVEPSNSPEVDRHYAFFLLQGSDCGAFNKAQQGHMEMAKDLANYLNKLNTTEFLIPPNLQHKFDFQKKMATRVPVGDWGGERPRDDVPGIHAVFPRLSKWGFAFGSPLQLCVWMHQAPVLAAMIEGQNRGINTVWRSVEVEPSQAKGVDSGTRALLESVTFADYSDTWRMPTHQTENAAKTDANVLRDAIRLVDRPKLDFTYLPPSENSSLLDFFLEDLPVEISAKCSLEAVGEDNGSTPSYTLKYRQWSISLPAATLEHVFIGTPTPIGLNTTRDGGALFAFIPPTPTRGKEAGPAMDGIDGLAGVEDEDMVVSMRKEIGGGSDSDSDDAEELNGEAELQIADVGRARGRKESKEEIDTTSNALFPLGGFAVFGKNRELLSLQRIAVDSRLRDYVKEGGGLPPSPTRRTPVAGDSSENDAEEVIAAEEANQETRRSVVQGTTARLCGPFTLRDRRMNVILAPREGRDSMPLVDSLHFFHLPNDHGLASLRKPFEGNCEVAWVPAGTHLFTETPMAPVPFGGLAFKSSQGRSRPDVLLYTISERPSCIDPWKVKAAPVISSSDAPRREIVELLVKASTYRQEVSQVDDRLWEMTNVTRVFDRFGLFSQRAVGSKSDDLMTLSSTFGPSDDALQAQGDCTAFCLLLQRRMIDVITRYELLAAMPYRSWGTRLQVIMDHCPENRVMLAIPRDVMRASGFRIDRVEDHGLSLLHWSALCGEDDLTRAVLDPARNALDVFNDRGAQDRPLFTRLQFLLPTHFAAYVGCDSSMQLLCEKPVPYRNMINSTEVDVPSWNQVVEEDLGPRLTSGKPSRRGSMMVKAASFNHVAHDRRISRDAVVEVLPGETGDDLAPAAPVDHESSTKKGSTVTVDNRPTPMALAAVFSHDDTVKRLLHHGADATVAFQTKVAYSSAHNRSTVAPHVTHRPSLADVDSYDIAVARYAVAKELEAQDRVPTEPATNVVLALEEDPAVRRRLNKAAYKTVFWETIHPVFIVVLGCIYFSLLYADSSYTFPVSSEPYWANEAVTNIVGGAVDDGEFGGMRGFSDFASFWTNYLTAIDSPDKDIFVLGSIMFGVIAAENRTCDWSLSAKRYCIDERFLVPPQSQNAWNYSNFFHQSPVTAREYDAKQFDWTVIPADGNATANFGDISRLVGFTTRVVWIHTNFIMPAADRLVSHLMAVEVLPHGAIIPTQLMYVLRPTFFPSPPGPQDRGRQFIEALIVIQFAILSLKFILNLWRFFLVAKRETKSTALGRNFPRFVTYFPNLFHVCRVIIHELVEQRWTVTLMVILILSFTFNGLLRASMNGIVANADAALSDATLYVESFHAGTALRYVRTMGALALFITSFGTTSGLRYFPEFGPPTYAIIRVVVSKKVLIFFILYFIYLMAISIVAYTLFAGTVYQFRQFYPTIVTSFLLMVGGIEEPNFDNLNPANPIATPVFFMVIFIFIQLTFLNLLIAVVSEEYNEKLRSSQQWWFAQIREQLRKNRSEIHGWPLDRTMGYCSHFLSWLSSLVGVLHPTNYTYYRNYVTANAEPFGTEHEYHALLRRGTSYFERIV